MKNNFPLLILSLIFLAKSSFGQSTFLNKLSIKISDETHIQHTNDEGWIVTYSIKNDPSAFYSDAIQVLKFNICNEIEWSKEYSFFGERIDVGGMLVHSNGDIFLSGWVEDIPNNEDFFFLKLNADGSQVFFRTYRKPFREILYDMDETSTGNIMLFGISYTSQNTPRNTFIILNPVGDIVSATSHGSAGIWGRGLACSDGGYIGRMGGNLFKVDANGNTIWANYYNDINNSCAPVEVEDGYIFATSQYSTSILRPHFLYKLNFNGEVVWVSPGFQARGYATLELLANGNILCMDAFVEEATSDKQEISLLEFSPTGQQLSNKKIFNTYGLVSGITADMALKPDGSLLFSALSGVNRDTLYIGKAFSNLDFACEPIANINEDTIALVTATPFSMPRNDISFDIEDHDLDITDITLTSETVCSNTEVIFPTLLLDTTVCIGEEVVLEINFPEAIPEWPDGSSSNTFAVNKAGNYEVSVSLCGETELYSFEVTEEDCSCKAVFPNAFTPNGDGHNDVFQILTTCEIVDYQLDIYNRWGEKVFDSTDFSSGWNGTQDGSPAPMDQYIYHCLYIIENSSEELLSESGDLTLIR